MRERVFVLRSEHVRERLIAFICALALTARLFEVTIRPFSRKRSIAQNRRYWAILRDIAEQYVDANGERHNEEIWHEQMKRQFIGCQEFIDIFTGEVVLHGISTAKLSVEEFGDYMTQVEAWASSVGIEISADPNQYHGL